MSAQSVTRIAGSGTTVYQCCKQSQSVQDCASFVFVVQELEQDRDEVVILRPETQHCGHVQKQKRKFGQKGRLNVRAS